MVGARLVGTALSAVRVAMVTGGGVMMYAGADSIQCIF